jgi:LCP family protein required for cell wall assembly
MKKRIAFTVLFFLLTTSLLSGAGWLISIDPACYLHNKSVPLLTVSSPWKQGNRDDYPKAYHGSGSEKSPPSINILILGIDARDSSASRADMIMVANVNSHAKTVNLVSIPRDTKIKVAGIGYTKINHTHLLGEIKGGNQKGTQATLIAVSNILQCRLNYYVKVNFQGFVNFIDTLGGLDIRLPKPVKLTFKSMTLPAGINHLDGEMTLELTRERYSLANGDFGRQQNQLLILKTIAKQILNVKNIGRLSELISLARRDMVDTNLTNMDLMGLAWLLRQVPEASIRYHQMRGKSEKALDPLTKTVVYYWRPDMEDIKRVQTYFR